MTSDRWIKRSNIAAVRAGSPSNSPQSPGPLLDVRRIED